MTYYDATGQRVPTVHTAYIQATFLDILRARARALFAQANFESNLEQSSSGPIS